ncbi:RraA family protein [Arthrobacter sp. ZGTC412]|uniref:RraA family protein n=1 Tax=Arthrobacter sp. ZGTC412 TaxID=2058900 RepID=UPI0021576E6F|nr:methyltransferase [Arthrobacter sp. ZGTC412]
MNGADVVRRLSELPTPNIGDAMERLNVVDGAIASVWPGARMAGRAFTVYVAGGDNLGIHEAIPQLSVGDVLVVNGQGATHRALIGELIAGRAAVQGCAGFVLDAAVRDVRDLQEMGFPVFARSTTPAGPYRNGPFRVGEPVAIGSVVVRPGDVIIGDDDGVVVVPWEEAAAVAEAAEAKRDSEAHQRAEIEDRILPGHWQPS